MAHSRTRAERARDLTPSLSIGGLLGCGGMAEVYAATLADTGRPVAVKRIKPGLSARDDVRERFANEIDILRRCRGVHVLELIDSGSWDGLPSYVCERCTGSLKELARARPLPPARALQIAGEILIGLDRVHGLGIVHRDIKPGNVLLGDDGLVRLADFGIAMHPSRRLTLQGSRLGTERYAPPEMLEDPRSAAPAHDLFALGLLIFAVVTHKRPEHLTDPAHRNASLASVPSPLASLVDRATHPVIASATTARGPWSSTYRGREQRSDPQNADATNPRNPRTLATNPRPTAPAAALPRAIAESLHITLPPLPAPDATASPSTPAPPRPPPPPPATRRSTGAIASNPTHIARATSGSAAPPGIA